MIDRLESFDGGPDEVWEDYPDNTEEYTKDRVALVEAIHAYETAHAIRSDSFDRAFMAAVMAGGTIDDLRHGPPEFLAADAALDKATTVLVRAMETCAYLVTRITGQNIVYAVVRHEHEPIKTILRIDLAKIFELQEPQPKQPGA